MSDELPIRITSVFTLAENRPKTSKNELKENLSGKTEQNNPSVWQNLDQQCSETGPLKDGKEHSLIDVYCSSKELMKLAAKHGKNTEVSHGSVPVAETENNTKIIRLPTNTVASTDISGRISLGDNAIDNIYTVFRVTKDSCPSFCCQYSPALIATLRARASTLSQLEIHPKAPHRPNFTATKTSATPSQYRVRKS